MIKLLKDTSKSITDANYNEFSCVLTVLSITCSVVFGVITGISYFATTPEEIGNLSHVAPPGDKVWLIGLIIVITSIVFGIFALFATCSGTLLMIAPFILLYDFVKHLFYAINFCLEHFFMLFAPRKTKEKMIVREKTEKEMISTYNNFLKN